jgi:hypothetical protein
MSADNPYLLLESGGGERFPLKDPTTLGRTQGNDVVLPDPGCSSRHAVIRQESSGWVIEDLGSTNGTWVNGDQLKGIKPLMEGDLIQMGAQSLRVQGLPVELRCARCGTIPLAKAAFCPTCGLPLNAASPSATVAMPPPRKPAPVLEPPPTPQTPTYLQTAVIEPIFSTPTPVAPKKKGNSALFAGIGLGALALLITATVLFWPRLSHWLPGNGSTQVPSSAASKDSAKEKHPLPPKLAFLREAILFRKAASSSNLPKTIEHYEAAGALGFLVGSTSYQEAPAIWSYFFSGAVILGGQMESPNPVIAYYNPYLDGVLLTQWEQKDGQARIIAADLRIASQMAGQQSAHPNLAWWLSEMARRPIAQVLKEQYGAFLNAFGRTYPVDSTVLVKLETSRDVAAVRTILEGQAIPSFLNLANLQNPKSPVFSPELAAMKKALRSGDALALSKLMPANNPMKAEALAAQSSWIRQTAVPMYAMTGMRKTIVLLASSDAPRFYLLAAWATKPSPHLESLVPYDMDGITQQRIKTASEKGVKP